MKRRRRALGSPPSQHAIQRDEVISKLGRRLDAVETSLKKGNCKTAFYGLLSAAQLDAQAITHHLASEQNMPLELSRSRARYRNVEIKFGQTCRISSRSGR